MAAARSTRHVRTTFTRRAANPRREVNSEKSSGCGKSPYTALTLHVGKARRESEGAVEGKTQIGFDSVNSTRAVRVTACSIIAAKEVQLTNLRPGQPARMDTVSLGCELGTPSFARRRYAHACRDGLLLLTRY